MACGGIYNENRNCKVGQLVCPQWPVENKLDYQPILFRVGSRVKTCVIIKRK